MLSLRRYLTRPATLGLAQRQAQLGASNGVKRYSSPLSAISISPFSTSSRINSQRTKFINALVEELGPDYRDVQIDTAVLLETLRNMQSYRHLTPNDSKSPEYRSSLRAVSQLSGADGGVSKPKLTIRELEGVITPENGVTWRVIHELLKFGFSTELESVGDQMKSAIMFNRVHGFGKIRSLALAEHGARTLDDLLKSEEKEYGRKIAKAQKLAIRHHKDMELMIPRSEVEVFKGLFEKAFKAADPETKFEIMGSFRRGEEVSSDIDVVVWHPSFVTRDKDEKRAKKVAADSIMGKVLMALSKANLLDTEMMFTEGEKKSMFLTRLPGSKNAVYRQIDIRLCPTESLPYMLLGNSGDDSLMKLLRWRAMEKGLALNEYGMGKRSNEVPNGAISVAIGEDELIIGWPIEGTEIIVKDEKEIFERLGVPFLEPRQRKYTYYRTLKQFREWGV